MPTYFVALIVIALRWQYLLRAVRLVPLHALAQLVTICYMGNGVYPLRAGEALRIYLLRRNHNVPLASATTTVMVERAFDGVVMLSFVLLSLQFIDIQSAEVETIVSIATPLFVGAVLVFFSSRREASAPTQADKGGWPNPANSTGDAGQSTW